MMCKKYMVNERKAEISVLPDKDSIKTVTEFFGERPEAWKLPMKLASKLQIAVDEIYSNIVYYSHAENAKITVSKGDEKLTLTFEDDGMPYDPTTAKEPDVTLSAEERDIGGLGIYMVKKLAADICYENIAGKNVLRIAFDIK